MIRSMQGIFYSMRVQLDRMEIIANNIANISTKGYKKESSSVTSFADAMVNALDYNTGKIINNTGIINFGTTIDEVRVLFDQGFMENTDCYTDFAIKGNGFFEIETPQGLRYTRAGNFTFNDEGYLVTQDGNYVMGQNGRIRVQNAMPTVDLNGNIKVENANNEFDIIDRFRIVHFYDLNALEKSDNGYINTDTININNNAESEVLQGYLENSNVDIIKETLDLMETKRQFESCQQIVRMVDDTYGKAVNEIGRV